MADSLWNKAPVWEMHERRVRELNARFKDDGWRSAGLDKMCPRCQEERLITATTIFGRTDYYCDVCAFSWKADDLDVV